MAVPKKKKKNTDSRGRKIQVSEHQLASGEWASDPKNYTLVTVLYLVVPVGNTKILT